MLARVTPAESLHDLPNCGLVIEAVPEDLDLKRRIFSDLADRQPSTTVLATNTSSIDIDDIADDVADPERVLGLHFFNPPPVMKLVEVVHGERTAQAYVEHATALMTAWGKTPVRCSSTPGFIVNGWPGPSTARRSGSSRAALPTRRRSTGSSVSGEASDGATRAHRLHRSGRQPRRRHVGVGADGRDERYTPTTFQQDLVAAGRLGRKSGRGVYTYAADGSVDGAEPDVELAERLVGGTVATDPLARTLAMIVNEAVDLVARGEASATTSTRRCGSARDTRRAPSRGGREIGFDVVAASSPSSTRPIRAAATDRARP